VAIETEQEQRFYDGFYGQFLAAPDHALRIDRALLIAQFDNPGSTFFERRRLYHAALEQVLAEPLAGTRALDYGCGCGEWGVMMATEGAEAALLDLSPVGIEIGLRRARASGVADQVRGFARDASDLSCFADAEFDLVFGCGALHHTIKYGGAYDELIRVIRPGGRLILAESWSGNPVLNAARRMRARWANEPEEAGEGVVFGEEHARLLRERFREVSVAPLNLFAMAKRFFRGKFPTAAVRASLSGLEKFDRLCLAAAPGLDRFCGEALVVARK
jgi:SAM-dependent methyltransferase